MAVIKAHINGVEYTLANPGSSDEAQRFVEEALEGTGKKTFPVLFDKVRVDVTIEKSQIWAIAAWAIPEQEPVLPLIG